MLNAPRPHDVGRRHEQALAAIEAGDEPRPLPERGPSPPTAWPGGEPPTCRRDELDAERVREAIADAGCLRVEGLIDADRAGELADAIDRAFAASHRHEPTADTADPWFDPYVPDDEPVHLTRSWLRDNGGLFAADSPVVGDLWFSTLRDLGVVALVESCFGETPITSLDKCALRKVRQGGGIEWHQDGAFLDPDNGALNLWTSLSDTATRPGLDLLGRRLDELVETGTGGAGYSWSAGPEVVAELAADAPVVSPHFGPGDALLFDGLLLHRSARPDTARPDPRFAIETWFFRPSRFPDHQAIPLAL